MFSYALTIDRQRLLTENNVVVREGSFAAPHYLTVDPADFAAKVERAGLLTRRIPCGRGAHFGGAWKSIVEVREPGADNGYKGAAAFLFGHDGKTAVRARAGAIRVACMNQFLAPVMRFVHTSHAIRDFWIDPVPYVREVLAKGKVIPERLESLKGIGDGRMLVQASLAAKPRLLRKVRGLMWGSSDAGQDLWAAFQALTASRSPTLTIAAGDWLGDTDTFEALRAGRLPEDVATRFDTPATLALAGSN